MCNLLQTWAKSDVEQDKFDEFLSPDEKHENYKT